MIRPGALTIQAHLPDVWSLNQHVLPRTETAAETALTRNHFSHVWINFQTTHTDAGSDIRKSRWVAHQVSIIVCGRAEKATKGGMKHRLNILGVCLVMCLFSTSALFGGFLLISHDTLGAEKCGSITTGKCTM